MKWGWWRDYIEFTLEPKPLLACHWPRPYWRLYYPPFVLPCWQGLN